MNQGATHEGTVRFAASKQKRILKGGFRQLGRTGLMTSGLGFGCYRVEDEKPQHQWAMVSALKAFCNLIDTSTNYTDGSSEICVGKVLKDLFATGELNRDEVIVVSKVGYVQGQNLKLVKDCERQSKPFSDVVRYADGCWHCIHPEFLSVQLGSSLDRLKLDQIDVYLLHNPEYFLMDYAKQIGSDPKKMEKMRAEFYERIRLAFLRLEEEVSKGRIQCYGVSSNTFVESPDDSGFTSVSQMWDIAEEVGQKLFGKKGAHHFSVIQLPMNLLESGAVLQSNNGAQVKKTALEFALEVNLGVLVNRPLNAYAFGHLVRLVDFPVDKELEGSIRDQAKRVSELEAHFRADLGHKIFRSASGMQHDQYFRWGDEIGGADVDSIGMENWRDIEEQMIKPQLRRLTAILDQELKGEVAKSWRTWRDRYAPEVERLLTLVRNECAKKSQKMSEALSRHLNPFLPKELIKYPLCWKALGVLLNTDGVGCVLNGMRSEEYVKDAIRTMELESYRVSNELYKTFENVFKSE